MHAGDALFGGKGSRRDTSRAATAATTTSSFRRAGLRRTVGVMRAAPKMPIRTGVSGPDTDGCGTRAEGTGEIEQESSACGWPPATR